MQTAHPLVIIPTYNEAENIGTVIGQVLCLPLGFHILVVDDGSPDGTGDLVEALKKSHSDRIFLIRRAGKQGLGTAYLAGFKYALENGYQWICEMDADMSHNPSDLERIAEPVMKGESDLAIGSRYVNGVRVMNWPLSRLMLSYGAGMYTRAITGFAFKTLRRVSNVSIDAFWRLLTWMQSDPMAIRFKLNSISKRGKRDLNLLKSPLFLRNEQKDAQK